MRRRLRSGLRPSCPGVGCTPSPAQPVSRPASRDSGSSSPPGRSGRRPAGRSERRTHALHYNWHRHYDPSVGRYTQPDPLGFVDGPSVYAYAMSNPHAFVDPTGLWTWIFGGGATVAGGVVGGTYNGGILVDANTGRSYWFWDYGWQGGFNMGGAVYTGFYTGSPSDLCGWASEYQLNLGLFNINFFTTRSANGSRNFGVTLGGGLSGIPAGASVGRTRTNIGELNGPGPCGCPG